MAEVRQEAIDSNAEVFGFSLKEGTKIGVGVITAFWNGYELSSRPDLSPIASAFAFFSNAYFLAEKAYPPLKGSRPIFAVSPLELYHLAHVASSIFNAVALGAALVNGGPLPTALFAWNVLTSRPALHIGNSICGSLVSFAKSV